MRCDAIHLLSLDFTILKKIEHQHRLGKTVVVYRPIRVLVAQYLEQFRISSSLRWIEGKKKSWRKTFPFTLVLDETFKGNRFLQVVHPVYVFRNEVFSNGEFFDYCFERVFVPNYYSTLSTHVRNAIVRCFFTIYRVIVSRMLQRYTYNLYSLMLYQRNRKLHQLSALVVRVS